MIKRFHEITCDQCGCAEQFTAGGASIQTVARDYGWIITRNGKHFDSKECYDKYRQEKYHEI